MSSLSAIICEKLLFNIPAGRQAICDNLCIKSMKKKAVVLFSGGLDSILAAKIIMDQDIEVLGINFSMEFVSKDVEKHKKRIKEIANSINMEFKIVDISDEYMGVLKNPAYGFGSNINPCIDCKILMLKKAKDIIKEAGAEFVVTGEVLGERPMSQRMDALNAIENKSGLKGYLLRPLSAKLLKPTIPEEKGIVDRNRLFGISGRSRKPQFELAGKLGIKNYFAPAGGCLLTDPGFARRLGDLIDHDALFLDDIRLLKFGRHFRFGEKTKFVLGRNKEDNEAIMNLKKENDAVFEPYGYQGPIGILRGERNDEFMKLAAGFLISHTKVKNDRKANVRYWTIRENKNIVSSEPARREKIDEKRI